MSKNKKTKQNKQTMDKQKTIKQNKWFKIVGLSISVILLVLVLFGLLKINANVKSESDKIVEKVNSSYESSEANIIYYYDSEETENEEGTFELDYIKQISKDYKVNYTIVDTSKVENKDLNYIHTTLGITGKVPTTVIVKNKNVLGVQEGYKEGNRLVEFMIQAELLPSDSKYLPFENLTFIDYKQYKKLLEDKKKSSIIIIGQPACQYCIGLKNLANNIAKAYEVKINYLDVMELDSKDRKEFFENLPDLGYEEESLQDNVFSMPTTFIVKKKKIVAYQQGAQTLENYKTFLKDNKVIE